MMFSIIIPLYNKEAYVTKALESVLAQTFRDFELIVVDDGSGDRSREMAEAVLLKATIPYQILCQENAGVSVARNNGVAASKGDYLCFLDADDWWSQTFLEEMAGLISEYPDAGLYGTGYTIVNETKRKTRVAPVGVEDGFEKGYINYFQVYAKTLCMPVTSITACIPKRDFERVGGFPEGITLGEDFLLWTQIAKDHKVAFLNNPLANYNQDVNGTSRAVGQLHTPSRHMLWNLHRFSDMESSNPDYKRLIDRIRAYGLWSYWLSPQYHSLAEEELEKVDKCNLDKYWKTVYRFPAWIMRGYDAFLRIGAITKAYISRLI